MALPVSAQMIENFTHSKPTEVRPVNVLSFSLPESQVTHLHRVKGEKLTLKSSILSINGDSVKSKRIKLRGTSSSQLKRKSFNIRLARRATFGTRPDTFSLTKFYAISMNMDRNYIRNLISNKVLSNMGIAIPDNCYSNVLINKNSEGLYMIFNPPEQFAIARGASVVLRRVHQDAIDDLDYAGISSKEAAALKKKFQSIYVDILRKYHGEQLYHQLNTLIDLDSYFVWLAFNHLFQNGDYSDELYFMWRKNHFEIIPWDFDDLLRREPHEGLDKRNAILGEKLIYSSEDALDVAIANDQFLYNKYLIQYKRLLEELKPEKVFAILNEVYQSVYPYFLQPEIIVQSQYDRTGATDLGNLEKDINDIAGYISARIVIHRDKIKVLLEE